MNTRHPAIRNRSALLVVAIALSSVTVAAHDMWIEPATFAPRPGDIVAIRLRVGQDLLGDPIPRDPSLINQFIVEDSTGRKTVVGRDGGDPAGFVRAVLPGPLIVGYSSNPSAVELPAEKFNQYLKDEGLDAVAATRGRRNETTRGAHEIFSRCAKTLIASGDRRLGFTLELVAERNPFELHPGDELPVTLTYQNRPLAGAQVIAINRAHPAEKLKIRTDAKGRVLLRLPEPGLWLIKAVHMIAAPAGTNAEWASYWASLTFELPAAAASMTATR